MLTKRQKGFSLVELLVVIAIILVLVALVLPMTLRLEDSVNTMIDINNFRNIYQAMYAYAEDNKGHIPHHQATKELGYYACWNAWEYWKVKLGKRIGDKDWNETRKALIGCVGHSSAGYTAVVKAYDEYIGRRGQVFYCHSPKAGQKWKDSNYNIRTSNSCGGHGTDGPPGGWIISTHNPKATIISDGGQVSTYSWVRFTDGMKRSPFHLQCMQYGRDKYIWPWRHMDNKFPRIRLDGSASVVKYHETWSTFPKGGWYPGGGGE